jgi:hypothetical protein
MSHRVWTEAMDDILREVYPAGGGPAVSAAIWNRLRVRVDRSHATGRAYRLGLITTNRGGYKSRTQWAPEEEQVLRTHYVTGGPDACMRLLAGRSREAIAIRAQRLGLRVRQGADAGGAMICDDNALCAAMRRIDELTRSRLRQRDAGAEA